MRGVKAFVLVMLALAGCGGKPEAPPSVTAEMPLAPQAQGEGPVPSELSTRTLVYRAPGLDVTRYHGLMVLPTIVYDGSDGEWGGTTPEQRQEIATLLTAEFRRALRQHRHVVDKPGRGTVALQLTLTGIAETRPVASLTRLTPIGMGLSAVKSAVGMPAVLNGSITIAGKLTDAQTGELLGGFLSKESPLALDLRTAAGTMAMARIAAARGADDFSRALDRLVAEARNTKGRPP